MQKYGITAEQAAGGSPDLARLIGGSGAEANWFTAGDRLPFGIEAFPGREPNDLVLWVESRRAVIVGDTLADFGRGFEMPVSGCGKVSPTRRSPPACVRSSGCRSSSCSRRTERRQTVLGSRALSRSSGAQRSAVSSLAPVRNPPPASPYTHCS